MKVVVAALIAALVMTTAAIVIPAMRDPDGHERRVEREPIPALADGKPKPDPKEKEKKEKPRPEPESAPTVATAPRTRGPARSVPSGRVEPVQAPGATTAYSSDGFEEGKELDCETENECEAAERRAEKEEERERDAQR